METIITSRLQNAVSYDDYRAKIKSKLEADKATAAENPMTHYILLNETRMDRLEKTISVDEDSADKLRNLKRNYTWLVISEGWCGDAAQLVPIFHKLDLCSPKIEMKIVFRDENDALMDLFLTNGSRSIPKLIVLDGSRVVSHWGPRPKGAADLIVRYKAEKGSIDDEAKKDLQLWYLHDKGRSTINEIVEMMLECDSRD